MRRTAPILGRQSPRHDLLRRSAPRFGNHLEGADAIQIDHVVMRLTLIAPLLIRVRSELLNPGRVLAQSSRASLAHTRELDAALNCVPYTKTASSC